MKPFQLLAVICLCALGHTLEAEVIYKWVDDQGVPHYSNSVPEGISNYETLGVEPAPAIPSEVVTAPPPKQPGGSAASETIPSAPLQPETEQSTSEFAQLSVAELEQRCEGAREQLIAPLRAAEIERCQADPDNDPAWCQRYFADFGDAARQPDGVMGPRLFDDLPECLAAEQARARQGGTSR